MGSERAVARGWRSVIAGSAAALALLLAGCWQYEIEVTVAPNGSGTRTLRLQADPEDLEEAAGDLTRFVGLFGLDAGAGWSMAHVRESGGRQELLEFTRRSAFAGPGEWSRAGGDVQIAGTLEEGAGRTVVFANMVSLEMGAGGDPHTCTYRERFTWAGLREVIIARQAEAFYERLRACHPALSDEDRPELAGLLAGAMLATVELEVTSIEREGVAEALARAVEAHTEDIIRRRDPQADCGDLGPIVHEAITAADKDLEAFLHVELPGAYLAGATSIDLRVTMPGRILESNADRIEGKTAHWSMDTWDALVRPIELYVRAEMSD